MTNVIFMNFNFKIISLLLIDDILTAPTGCKLELSNEKEYVYSVVQ